MGNTNKNTEAKHEHKFDVPNHEHKIDVEKDIKEMEKLMKEKEAKGEKVIAQEEKTFKQKLKAQKKVPMLIPLDPLNPHEPAIVGINGVIYSIPRGKQVDVPEQIAKIWNESYNKTLAIQMRNKVKNLDKQKDDIEILD